MQPQFVITGGDDENLDYLDYSNGTRTHRTSVGCKVFDIIQISDTCIANSGYDNQIHLWNVTTHTHSHTLSGHENDTKSLEFNRDRHVLFSAGSDNTVRLWTVVETGETETAELRSVLSSYHDESVYALCLLRKSYPDMVFSGSYDDTVKSINWVRDMDIGSPIRHSADVESLASDNGRNIVFSGGDDGLVRVNSCSGGSGAGQLATEHSIELGHPVYSLCFIQQRHLLLCGLNTGEIVGMDVRKLTQGSGGGAADRLLDFQAHDGGDLWYIRDCLDGHFLSTSWGDDSTKKWDMSGVRDWSYDVSSDITGVCAFHVPFGAAYTLSHGVVSFEESGMFDSTSRSTFRLDELLLERAVEDPLKCFEDQQTQQQQQHHHHPFAIRLRFRQSGEDVIACRSFLAESPVVEPDTTEIVIEEDLDIDSVALLALLGGDSSRVDVKRLIDYYQLFRILKMPAMCFLVCREVARVRDPGLLVYFADLAMKRFEDVEVLAAVDEEVGDFDEVLEDFEDLDALMKEEDALDGTFDDAQQQTTTKSAFTLAVLAALKGRKADLETSSRLTRALTSRRLVVPIVRFGDLPFAEHVEFCCFEDDQEEGSSGLARPANFELRAREKLRDLFDNRTEFSNCTLIARDGARVRAHLDVLLSKSHYFRRKVDTLQALDLSLSDIFCGDVHRATLEAVLQMIYCGKIFGENMPVLLAGLRFGVQSEDETMIRLARAAVASHSLTLTKSDLLDEVGRCVGFLASLTEVTDIVREIWVESSMISEDDLLELLHECNEIGGDSVRDSVIVFKAEAVIPANAYWQRRIALLQGRLEMLFLACQSVLDRLVIVEGKLALK